MKKSLLNPIAIIIALLMIAGCPDPVNTPTPETPEQPLDTTTPAKPTQPPSSINPGTPTQHTDPTTPSTPEETVTSVNYTVKHMKQDVTGNGYTEDTDARQTLSGTPGGTTAAQARSFTGFTAKTFSQATIAEDGSTIVTINYDRNVHSVSYSATTSGVTAPAAASYRFGAQVTVEFPTGISAWSGNGTSYSATRNTFTMPDSDVVLSETYTITVSNVAETLTTLPDNDAAAPYTLVVSDSADLAAIAQAISGSDIYVTLSLENCEGLTSLTDGMFQGCDNLASITLPASLSSIGDNAFKGCTGLTNIVIPETVDSVGSDIFSGCTNLESVTFSGSVSSSCVADIINELPQGAVIEAADTAALASVIQGINSSNSSVSLSLENCTGLTTLADNAFQGCDNLTSVTLPASVSSISGTAFSGCSSLTSITVSPDNNSYSSEDGTLLGNSGTTLICCPEGKTSVSIPSSVTSIGDNAFDGCTGLTNIVIPENVTSVGSDIFSGCTNLESVTFSGSVSSTCVAEIIGELPQNTVIEAADTNSFSSVIQGINNANSSVSLSLENCTGLTTLADNAFQGCDNLASVTLPASVTSISGTAFSGCSDLVSITVSPDNNSYSSKNGTLLDKNKTTLICCPEGKTEVSIPSSVTTIGDNAFDGCTGLTNIVIPETVTSVGSDIFSGCTNLDSVTFSGSVSSSCVAEIIDELPQNTVIEAADTNSFSSVIQGINNANSSVSLSLENCTGLTTLSDNAFQGCDNLTSVTLPASVTSISGTAFSGCSDLVSINVPAGNSNYSSANGFLLNSNGTALICCPEGKNSLTIPETVTSIGDLAFNGCTGLTSITFPDEIESIDNYAFYGCTGLTNIVIQGNVTVDTDVFTGCTNLKSVTLPGTLEEESIQNIINSLPTNTTSTPLSINITSQTQITSIQTQSIKEAINKASCSGERYVSLSLEHCQNLTSLPDNAFDRCDYLSNITLPDGLTSIGNSAFERCLSLDDISIPDSVTTIGNGAFDSCYGLQSITLSENLESIGNNAFYACTSLESITLPNNLESVGNNAFMNCTSLTSITIPSSVTSVGEDIFSGCTNLKSVVFAGEVDSEVVADIINDLPTGTIIEAANTTALASIIEGISNASSNVSLSLENCEGLTSLTNGMFQNCANLTSIVIPETVTSVGSGVFSGCTDLKSVTLPGTLDQTSIKNTISSLPTNATNTPYTIELTNVTASTQISDLNTAINNSGKYIDLSLENCTGLTSLPNNAFLGCVQLTGITLPPNLTILPTEAFNVCSCLERITFTSRVTIIGSAAFSNCSSLQSIEIPSSVTDIRQWAFLGCESLESISIPNSVTYIGDLTFCGCMNLSSIEIPSSVTYIGDDTFNGCPGLQSITVSPNNNNYSSENGILYNKKKTQIIRYPPSKTNTSLTLPSSVTSITLRAFAGCTNLQSITIPSSVRSIGTTAFQDCSALQTINFQGTKAQWNSISKGNDWNGYCPATMQVVCTDGTVTP